MTERALATIRKIDAISAIPDADSIEVATLGGWKVVIRKGEYQVGDLAIYAEIDSWIPNAIAPFLSKDKEPKVYQDIAGERLRSVRLRKQLSQGLLLPLTVLGIDIPAVGTDVTERLGILKWEPTLPAELNADAKGLFPSYVQKTDQERIQNLASELIEWSNSDLTWTVTEKCEGTSFTAFYNNGMFGVCSRNLELKYNETNAYWSMAAKFNLEHKLSLLGKNIAIQAELIGPGIQGNIYELTAPTIKVFAVYDIDNGCYFTPEERRNLAVDFGLELVPVIKSNLSLRDMSMDMVLTMAEGTTVIGTCKSQREGLVFFCNEKPISFKAINNVYLMGEPKKKEKKEKKVVESITPVSEPVVDSNEKFRANLVRGSIGLVLAWVIIMLMML